MAAPDDPTDLPRRSWVKIVKRTVREFQDDNLTDWAASLTYYGVMSLFPMLIALVAVLGLVGESSSVSTLLDSFRQAGLSSVADNIEKPLMGVVNAKGGAGALLTFGLLGSLWSASGYLGAFMRGEPGVRGRGGAAVLEAAAAPGRHHAARRVPAVAGHARP